MQCHLMYNIQQVFQMIMIFFFVIFYIFISKIYSVLLISYPPIPIKVL